MEWVTKFNAIDTLHLDGAWPVAKSFPFSAGHTCSIRYHEWYEWKQVYLHIQLVGDKDNMKTVNL